MVHLIVSALLPVFLGLLLGYFAGRRRIVDNRNIASLNVLLMQFCLPLTLFVSIAMTPQRLVFANGRLALVLAIVLVVVYVPIYRLERRLYRLSVGDSAVQALTGAFPNFASIGLPLLLPLFGKDAALSVAIAIATGSVTISPLTLALLELQQADSSATAGRAFLSALGKSVRKPIFVGPILGLLFAVSGLHLPAMVPTALGPMTTATAGIGLFLTGLMLSAQPIQIDRNVVMTVAVKNVLQPLLTFGLARLLLLPAQAGAEAALLCTIPAGFFGLVFGASAGVRPAVAGSTLVVSSLISIVTLSVAILWLAPA